MGTEILSLKEALLCAGISNTSNKLISNAELDDYAVAAIDYSGSRLCSEPIYVGCFWCFSSAHTNGQYQEGTVYSVSMQFWSGYGGTGTNFGTLSYTCGTSGGLPTTYNTDSLFFIHGDAARNGIGSITSQISIYKGYNQLETVYNTVSGVSLYPTPGCVFYFTIYTSVSPSSYDYGYLSSSISKETPAAAKSFVVDKISTISNWSNYIIK